MRELLNQIEGSLGSNRYFLSLMATLAVPDIAGALDSENGRATKSKYIGWYEEWVKPLGPRVEDRDIPEAAREALSGVEIESPLDGEACYQFRCSLLHQGRTEHPESEFDRIIFVEPSVERITVHHSILEGALCIDVDAFCTEVVEGARSWLDEAEGTDRYEQNYERFASRHPNGIEPYIVGVPVIG